MFADASIVLHHGHTIRPDLPLHCHAEPQRVKMYRSFVGGGSDRSEQYASSTARIFRKSTVKALAEPVLFVAIAYRDEGRVG
jgi:hypothetical protein